MQTRVYFLSFSIAQKAQSRLFAIGLGAHSCAETEIFAKTAGCGELHIYSDFLDGIIGMAQSVFYFTKSDFVYKKRWCSSGDRIAQISEIL